MDNFPLTSAYLAEARINTFNLDTFYIRNLESLTSFISTHRKNFVTARKLASRAAKSNKLKAFAFYSNQAHSLNLALKVAESRLENLLLTNSEIKGNK